MGGRGRKLQGENYKMENEKVRGRRWGGSGKSGGSSSGRKKPGIGNVTSNRTSPLPLKAKASTSSG